MHISSGHTLCPARESGVMPATETVSIAVINSSHVVGGVTECSSNRAVL